MFKVYRNLRRKCYSLMNKGKVVRHETHLVLENVKFNVRPNGRDKVRREKRKNVHAFVEGELSAPWPDYYGLTKVSYNPYLNDSFVLPDGTPIFSAKWAILTPNGCFVNLDKFHR
jgi:hypothetical protein